MKFKPQSIIIVLIIAWIIFIGWGAVKTTLQLSKQEVVFKEPSLQETEAPRPSKEKAPAEKTSPEKALQKPEIAPILVRAFKVKPTAFTDILPVMGTIKGETEIELRFERDGIIQSIYFNEGEKVNKGDIVANLDPKDAQLKLEYTANKLASAKAGYGSSVKKLEVHRKLYEAGAIIKSKLEEVELESESAKYDLETIKVEERLAKNELEKTNFYSPINSVMGPREEEEGEFVTPQDKVASLLKIENVLVEVGIVERDIHKVKLGQRAKVYVDAYPNIAFEGTVDKIFPIVEGKSRTLTTKIKVENPQGLLLPGMFSRAEISIIELKNAFIIPSVSLISAGKGTTLVPVIPAQSIETGTEELQTGVVQLRRVSVGYVTSDYAQITEGVNEDDLVVLEAQGELKDNVKVRISSIEEPSF
ncbi:MAG: efflux RND transporter periplasmic adaptor subunit [Candidatus Omnitrophota bacterium]